MGLKAKQYYIHIISTLLFLFLGTFMFAQGNLNYGTTNLIGKQLQVDKYDCKITPSFSINEKSPKKLILNFNVEWIDKKGNQVPQPDKISLFFNVNNNIEDYCTSNGKKLSTSPGLFGKKNIELTNSLSFVPAGTIDVAQYSHIHFKDKMAAISLNVLNHVNTPIKMNLGIYIGKEKGNSLEIEEKETELSWTIILPVLKTTEEVSCEDLESKYKQEFENNKPQFILRYFEDKLADLESEEEPQINNLYELRGNLFQYKSNVNTLVLLKEKISINPNFKKCDKLSQLIGSINSVIVDVSTIQALINRVNIDIKNNAGGSGAGSDDLPLEAFETNNSFCESTFNQLYNIKINPDLLRNYEPGYLDDLYHTLKNMKVSQDSLYNLIIVVDESPVYKRAYKNFNVNHSESIVIIEALNPDITNVEDQGSDSEMPMMSTGRSFPYKWVIIPLLLILAVFGGLKLFKYIKKGKSLKEKTK